VRRAVVSAEVDSAAVAVVTVATVRVVTDAVTLVRVRRVVLRASSLLSSVAVSVVAVVAVVRLPHLNCGKVEFSIWLPANGWFMKQHGTTCTLKSRVRGSTNEALTRQDLEWFA
jgi:hypothetical protein